MPCGYYLEEAEEEATGVFQHAELQETPAVRNGNVFAVDATSYFSRPGPRIVDGLEILAWALHPDAFPEPPPGRISPGRLGSPTMAGQNLVTPTISGKRVSFQFELPNGYLGEAVGIFERWDEDAETYFVRKKDGTEVRVPARGVRYGKVVPAS